MSRRNTPEVFWSRVQINGPDECWPWTGRVKPPTKAFPVGHGLYDHDGTWAYAHRYAWYLTYNAWPTPMALHHCDNPPCCNPSHLYEGTQQDNVRDREARGRRIAPRGEQSALSKLSAQDVEYIRQNYVPRSRGPNNLAGLAARFGVHLSTVHLVLKGHTYSNVILSDAM